MTILCVLGFAKDFHAKNFGTSQCCVHTEASEPTGNRHEKGFAPFVSVSAAQCKGAICDLTSCVLQCKILLISQVLSEGIDNHQQIN